MIVVLSSNARVI